MVDEEPVSTPVGSDRRLSALQSVREWLIALQYAQRVICRQLSLKTYVEIVRIRAVGASVAVTLISALPQFAT